MVEPINESGKDGGLEIAEADSNVVAATKEKADEENKVDKIENQIENQPTNNESMSADASSEVPNILGQAEKVATANL